MRTTLAVLAFVALVAADPVPQGVTTAIAPSGTAGPDCSENYNGVFQITPVNTTTTKRSLLEERQNAALGITLVNGILTDPVGRIGYVASNSQFQFDAPPQAGAIYTAGFSVCKNGSLAIGGDSTWYACLSGTFYNLYLDNDAGQCHEVSLVASRVAGSGGGVTTTVAGVGTTVIGSITAASNISTVISTFTGNTSTLSYDATAGTGGNATAFSSLIGATGTGTKATTKTTVIGGKTTKITTTGGGAQQTTTGGGAGAGTASASASSSTGAADFVGPVGGGMGLVAGLLALLAI